MVSCVSKGIKDSDTPLSLVQPKTVDLSIVEGLTYGDLVSLDKNTFLVELKGTNYKTLDQKQKKASLMVVNEKLKQQTLNMPSINLKHWLKKQLNKQSYFVESYLNSKTPLVILVQYGDRKIKESRVGDMNLRYLRVIAVDYQAYKNKKTLVPIWEGQISSIGYQRTAEEILPILGSFIDRIIGQNINERVLLPITDPVLEKTKDVPVTIVIDDLKPSLEELEFFN